MPQEALIGIVYVVAAAGSFLLLRTFALFVATVSSVAGLYASYRLDLPTGAAIVCALGLALLLTSAAMIFHRK